MKTKRFFWVLIALLIVAALVFSACAPADTVEDDEPVAAEPVTIRALVGNVGQELELSKDAAERYMAANPDVIVEVVDTPDFVEDRLGVYLQLFEAQSPEGDVFQIDVIWPGDLATHFVDLNDYGAGAVAGDHFPAIVENNTVDGALIGIPWFTDAGLLYYRADLLEKYGYDSGPTTWDELEEMAATIQEGERADGNADFWGFVWQGNAYEGLTCDALEWVYSNGGGTIVSPDKVITVNNPAAIAAVEQAAGWVGTISPPGVTGFGEEDARGVWQAGNAAFMRNWPYAYSLGQADDSAIKDLFDVSPLPAGAAGRGAATLGGWQLAVSKYSENPEVAADVALFFASAEEQKIRAIEGSFNPTILSVYDDAEVLEATPFFGSLYDVFINAVARPSTATAPNYAETSRIFFTGVHDVLTGENDAASAFEGMELDLVDLLGYEVGEPMGMQDVPMEPFRVGFVTDTGGIDDKSFNTTQWNGVLRAVDQLGVEAQFIQSDEASQYEANLTEFASQGYDLVIAAGFFLGGDLAKVAAVYPDVSYTIVDYAYPDPFGVPEGVVGNAECIPSVQGQVFKTDQAAFLAGYLAAGMTETGKLGYFGGAKIPTVTIFGVGFQHGMEYYNEVHGTSVELIGWDNETGEGLFTGDFVDLTKGKESTESLFDEGADIFMGVGGLIGSPGFDVARERGGLGIWVDVDGYNLLPDAADVMLTSVLKNMDNSVYDVIDATMKGEFDGCGVYVGDLINAGVGLAPYHDLDSAIPDDLKAEVEALEADIINGVITDTGCISYPAYCPGGLY